MTPNPQMVITFIDKVKEYYKEKQDEGYETISLDILIKDLDMLRRVFIEEYIKRVEEELEQW